MNYNKYETSILIDSLPQNRPLYKDSGLWAIYDDNFETPIIEQNCSESLRSFIIRYLEFLSKHEDVTDINIDIACNNLRKNKQ